MYRNRVQLHIRLNPKASSNRIGEERMLPDGTRQLKAYVTAVPEDGKANAALIELLAEHFGVAKSKITILRGATDRNKLLEIAGL